MWKQRKSGVANAAQSDIFMQILEKLKEENE